MSRRRERWLPVAAFLALAGVGGLVLVLLTTAVSDGRRALEASVLAEVQATARSQEARLLGQISPISGFIQELDLELDVDSAADRREFADIARILEDLGVRTGFYVTDADGVVTQGVHLDDAAVGRPVERPGFDLALEQFRAGERGAWLPVAPGLTTELPTFATVVPVRGEGGTVRGAFALESEVTADSGFNTEIGELGRGETGELILFDRQGAVIAASNPSLVGQQVPDADLVDMAPGVGRDGGEVRAVAEIPAAGWRVAFTQDGDEFDEDLAGPLQQVGLIIVVVFLAIGVAVFIGLARRLQASREEQERLRRLSETQEEFISIVSHELRTPVAGVLGFLQTTMDHWDAMTGTERFNAVRRAASNARRLQGLTRDVLDSQAVESGRMSYAMGDADLVEEVAVAVEAAGALHPRLTIETEADVTRLPVVADVDRIQQVLTNLLDNAAKVSPPGGTISVRVGQSVDRATVSVTDQGPGLSADMQGRVFDKFVRGRDTSVSGTGLGLYISRQILTAHGGDIEVGTGPSGGATFTFRLPVAAAEVPG